MNTTISEKRLAANRANAKKSRGPVTPQGKLNSARPSTRHTILANAILIDDESRTRFNALVNSLTEEFQPQTPSDHIYVDKLAVAQWNTIRLWGLQSAAINREIRILAEKHPGENSQNLAMMAVRNLSESGRTLDLLSLQMQRFDYQYNHAMRGLTHSLDRKSVDRKFPDADQSHQPNENKEALPETDPTNDLMPDPEDPTQQASDPTPKDLDLSV